MGETSDRKENDAPPRLLRVRIMDPVLLSCASLIIGFLSYLGATGSREDAKRLSELQGVETRARNYTDQRSNYLEGNLDSFREYAKETHKRHEEQLEYLRKLMIQVAK